MLGAHLVFLDESGFLLIPNVKRTWAFRGQTPLLGYFYKQDRISAINALAVSPQRQRVALYVRLRSRNLNGLDVLSFLRHLLRHLRGHVILLWDRGTIHKRLEVQQFIARRRRLHIEWFPAYAPELNPAEHVWNQNDSALANGSPSDLGQLGCRLRSSMQRVRGSQRLLWSCIYASDLPWKR
jgi:putative transposase